MKLFVFKFNLLWGEYVVGVVSNDEEFAKELAKENLDFLEHDTESIDTIFETDVELKDMYKDRVVFSGGRTE